MLPRLLTLLPASLLVLCSLLRPTTAEIPINYQSEHSNYGKYHDAVKEALKEIDPNASAPADSSDDVFWFFSLYDYNKDEHLDGHELRNAFTEYDKEDKDMQLIDVEEMIEHVLREDDRDNDGKISWEEYLASQTYHSG
ncbi:hypothetical protein HK102_000716 [Quaeritorhiza haematococci]|nr:hypothetical protein HK102_000716 [Quaeritorhiza haematococci]